MSKVLSSMGRLESLSPFGLSSKPAGGPLRSDDHFRKMITYFNEAAATLWGYRPQLGKSEWCGSWKLYWPDGTPLPPGECPMALALKEKRAVRGMEAVAERPDGTRVPFISYPTPLYSRTGKLLGAVNMLVDITDRKLAETFAQRIASIVESSDDAIISKDLSGTILSWNDGAGRLFGYTAEEMIGKPVTILIPPQRLEEEPGIISRIARGEQVHHYETIRRRKDGSLVNISLTVSPVKDANGKIIGASKIARDITNRKRAEEQKNLLLLEMKHRIKNTLATVQALATQTMRSASAEERATFLARLQSLANAHDLLVLEQWNRALLKDVVQGALDAFQEKQRERFLIEGPNQIWLDSDKSLAVAMALHELATNAVKYGALSNLSGRIMIAWEVLGNPARVKLHWKERGGPPVKPPKHKGFGSRLLQHALGGDPPKMDFDPRGLECVLDVVL